MASIDQPGVEYTQLTPEQQARATAMFHGDRMEQHTYALRDDGTLFQWRYYIPSQACVDMIAKVMTGK